MPWHVTKGGGCPSGKPWAVIKDDDGETVACHASENEANAQMAALYASEEDEMDEEGRTLLQSFLQTAEKLFRFLGKDANKDRAWDGSASNYSSTEQYCGACLIQVWKQAGRDEPAQSHCMLPVKRPGSGNYDFEGIQAAAGGHGVSQVKRPSDVPEAAWSAAVKKAANTIIAQYNANDKEAPATVYQAAGKEVPRAISTIRLEELAFAQLMSDPERWVWPMGVYLDGEDAYAVVAEDGKLFRIALEVLPDGVRLAEEWVPVVEMHQPATRTIIRQQPDNRYRWFSVSCTAVLNRVGEIDSRALFDDFVRQAEESGDYPQRDFYHLGEKFRTGQCDFLARDGNILVSSGLYDDTELARREIQARQAEPEFWGDSIAYMPLGAPRLVNVSDGIEIPVYEAGTLRFISTVPEAEAASLWTTGRVEEVNRMLEGKAFQAFVKLFGDDEEQARSWLAENADETNRAIEEAGAVTRAAEEPEPEAQPVAESEPEPVEREIELDDEAIGAIVERLSESEPFAEMSAGIENLSTQLAKLAEQLDGLKAQMVTSEAETEDRLAALERDDEEKQQEWQRDLPRRTMLRVTHRPRTANAPESGGGLADRAESTLAAMPNY